MVVVVTVMVFVATVVASITYLVVGVAPVHALTKAPVIAQAVHPVTRPEIEQMVLDYSLEYPTHGQVRVANQLRMKGVQISAGGIRSIWLRYDLHIKSLRLKRLEKWAAENTGILTESQVQALEAVKEEEEAYGEVESPHPGFLLAQDTCYIGYIKGVGRLYQQTAIYTHANIGFAKAYSKRRLSRQPTR